MMTNALRKGMNFIWAQASFQGLKIKRDQRRLDRLSTEGCRFLIAIPYLKSGGAEKVAANLASALAQLYGPDSVAIIVTDWSGWVVKLLFPENVPTAYPNIRFVNVVNLSLAPHQECVWDLMSAITTMRPEIVLNVNSQTMWKCWERFAPELADFTRLGTVAFCTAQDKSGNPIGYDVTHLERMLPYLDFVITDGQGIIETLRKRFVTAPRSERVLTLEEWTAAKLIATDPDAGSREPHDLASKLGERTRADWRVAGWTARSMERGLPPREVRKFKCLYQYAPKVDAPPTRLRLKNHRPQILWASRVSRSKYPELLPRIARLLPDCDIHAWGSRELGYRWPWLKKLLFNKYDLGDGVAPAPNLYWRGAFRGFHSLRPERFDAMIYTSLYDGLPNVLLEAGAYGVPLIAPSSIGAIGEVISDETGWPVLNPHDAREYAQQVRAVLDEPEMARERSLALLRTIKERHSFPRFVDSVRSFIERSAEGQRGVAS